MENKSDSAAKVITDAAQVAKDVIEKATVTAADLVKNDTENTTKALVNALREVFGENEEAQRFIDVSRIPLICKSILDIHANIDKINDKLDNKFVTNEKFAPVERVVYGAIGLILISVVGALLAVIIVK